MKRLISALSCAALGVGLATPCWADPDYSSDKIIEHFSKVIEAHKTAPAKTRSVFLGASGFAATDEARLDQERFNLLITFEYDSDQLTARARHNLDEFAAALGSASLSAARFVVEGHTDATGPDDYNMDLSKRRAASVVAYLISKGVERGRLSAKGYGETHLKSPRPDDPINRRVETRIAE